MATREQREQNLLQWHRDHQTIGFDAFLRHPGYQQLILMRSVLERVGVSHPLINDPRSLQTAESLRSQIPDLDPSLRKMVRLLVNQLSRLIE